MTFTRGVTSVSQLVKYFIHQFEKDKRYYIKDLTSTITDRDGWRERERERVSMVSSSIHIDDDNNDDFQTSIQKPTPGKK